MESSINLVSIYATNFIGILMMLMLLGNGSWKIKGRQLESKLLMILIVTIIVTCITDPIVFLCDGKPGTLPYMGVYVGNMLLFLANVAVGPSWLFIVSHYLNGEITRIRTIYVAVLCGIGVLLMVVNIFYPIVFSVDSSNIYHRGTFFAYYMLLEYLMVIDAMSIYVSAKKKGGVLKFFPVAQFVVPLLVGTTIQAVYYGVSVIWPSVGISVCGVLLGLQNEAPLCDGLTGLYNRAYLNQLRQRSKEGDSDYTMILLNINKFKTINEKYGHAKGDRTLMSVAEITRGTIGNMGVVIRYSSDQFFIFVNTTDAAKVDSIQSEIVNRIDEYNENSGEEFKITISTDTSVVNLYRQSVGDILHILDANAENRMENEDNLPEMDEKGGSDDEL